MLWGQGWFISRYPKLAVTPPLGTVQQALKDLLWTVESTCPLGMIPGIIAPTEDTPKGATRTVGGGNTPIPPATPA